MAKGRLISVGDHIAFSPVTVRQLAIKGRVVSIAWNNVEAQTDMTFDSEEIAQRVFKDLRKAIENWPHWEKTTGPS